MRKIGNCTYALIAIVALIICVYDAIWVAPQIEQTYFIPPIHNIKRFIAAPVLWMCLGFGLALAFLRKTTWDPSQKYWGILGLLISIVYFASALLYLTTMTAPIPTITEVSFSVLKAFHQTYLYQPVCLCLGLFLGVGISGIGAKRAKG